MCSMLLSRRRSMKGKKACDLVLSRFNNLTAGEEDSICQFVNSQIIAGNWDLIDDFFWFGLSNENDALTGFKLKTATKIGSPSHVATDGFTTGVGNYISSNYNPTSDFADGQTAYSYGDTIGTREKSNCNTSAFVKNKNTTGGAVIYSTADANGNQTSLKDRTDIVRVNFQSNEQLSSIFGENIEENTLYNNVRTIDNGSQTSKLYKNGAQVQSVDRSANSVIDETISFGFGFDGTITIGMIGGDFIDSQNFDYTSFYNDIINYLI